MIVVGHEAPSENREWIMLMDMQECPLQFKHIFFCVENGLPVIAAHNDVVIGIRVEIASSRHVRPPPDWGTLTNGVR